LNSSKLKKIHHYLDFNEKLLLLYYFPDKFFII